MARFGSALVSSADLTEAARRATAEALAPLAGTAPDLACVFVCTPDSDAAAEAGALAASATGAAAVVGCTAPGVLAAGAAVEAASAVAVWCAVLPQVRVRAFHLEVMPADAGMAVIGMPERHSDDGLALLFADPWSFPVDGFIERSNAALPGLTFVGGLASGLHGRGSTRLFLDGDVMSRGAVGVLLGGPVGARALVSQGCRPIGPPMTVTAVDGNVVLALAGVPAVRKLEEILGELDAEAQALATSGLQIGVAMDEYADKHGQGDFLVRGIGGVDEARGGLVVGDLLQLGQTVQLQVRDAAAAAADLAATLAAFRRDSSLDTVEGALLFTCNGRGRALFAAADHDLALVRSGLGVLDVGGFFAAGEIGPVGGRNHVHGLTAAVLAFGSGAAAERGTRPAAP